MIAHFPDHLRPEKDKIVKVLKDGTRIGRGCSICGGLGLEETFDLNVLNFERIKFGGVRHQHALYNMFDLERLLAEGIPVPTQADKDCLKQILSAADNSPEKTIPSKFVKEISPLLKSNVAEREVLVQILALADVLKPESRKSCFDAYVRPSDWEVGSPHSDWNAPAEFWRGKDGVNWKAVEYWFPDLGS